MIMKKSATTVLLLTILAGPAPGTGPAPDQKAAESIIVTMEDCQASRPGRITADMNLLALIFSGLPKEPLVKKGTVTIDGQKVRFYLPQAKTYTVKNSKTSDGGAENSSTAITVDQKGSGLFAEEDIWFANLPVRIGDRMFDVSALAADGSSLTLAPSRAPLRGVILNRQCPDFSLKTTTGALITNKDLAGKAFLLDIWSVT